MQPIVLNTNNSHNPLGYICHTFYILLDNWCINDNISGGNIRALFLKAVVGNIKVTRRISRYRSRFHKFSFSVKLPFNWHFLFCFICFEGHRHPISAILNRMSLQRIHFLNTYSIIYGMLSLPK